MVVWGLKKAVTCLWLSVERTLQEKGMCKVSSEPKEASGVEGWGGEWGVRKGVLGGRARRAVKGS